MELEKIDFDLSKLSFNDKKITIIIDEENKPWFYANEVAQILEYKSCKNAIYDNVKEKYIKKYKELGRSVLLLPKNIQQKTKFINEAGLYQLIMKSKNKIAESFQDWVFEEILPSIRKNGEYKLKKQHEEKISQLQIEFEEKLKLEESNSLKLKQLVEKKIEILKKEEYIYIATTEQYSKQNYFKVGGTTDSKNFNKNPLKIGKSRLSSYNVGRPEEDKYFYIFIAKCNNYKIIEDKLSILLNQHKPNDNKEMYNIHYDDLVEIISILIDNSNYEIDYLNEHRKKIYDNLISKEPKIIKECKKEIKLENKRIERIKEKNEKKKDIELYLSEWLFSTIKITNNEEDYLSLGDLIKIYREQSERSITDQEFNLLVKPLLINKNLDFKERFRRNEKDGKKINKNNVFLGLKFAINNKVDDDFDF